MEVQRYCVYNQTRESFLSLGVTVADAATGHVRELIDRVNIKPDSGLWMIPYRGIVPANGVMRLWRRAPPYHGHHNHLPVGQRLVGMNSAIGTPETP